MTHQLLIKFAGGKHGTAIVYEKLVTWEGDRYIAQPMPGDLGWCILDQALPPIGPGLSQGTRSFLSEDMAKSLAETWNRKWR